MKVKNFDDRKIESVRDKDIIEIVLEAKDKLWKYHAKDYIHHIYRYSGQGENKAFGKIRFISEKYYGKIKQEASWRTPAG